MTFRFVLFATWLFLCHAAPLKDTFAQNPWAPTSGQAHRQPVDLPVIGPTKIDGLRREIELAGRCATDVACAGGGRHLVLHFPEQNSLALFDLVEARVAGRIEVSPNITFAASANKLVVLDRNSREITRYDLLTLDAEQRRSLAVDKSPTQIRIGYASNGPIFLTTGDGESAEHFLLDLGTLAPARITLPESGWRTGEKRAFYMAGDGRTLGVSTVDSGSPYALQCLLIDRGESTLVKAPFGSGPRNPNAGLLIPGATGERIFGTTGMFDRKLKRIGNQQQAAIPAVGSHLFLTRSQSNPGAVQIHSPSAKQALVEIPGILNEVLTGSFADGMANPDSLNVFFVPAAKVLAVIPEGRSKLILTRFNLVHQTAGDRTTIAEKNADSGEPAHLHRLTTAAKLKRIRSQLTAGRILWDAPIWVQSEVIIVTITAGDELAYHTFEIHPN